jgi:hypothetical protein
VVHFTRSTSLDRSCFVIIPEQGSEGDLKKKQSFKTIRNFVCGIQQGITFFLGKQIRVGLNAPDNTSEGLAIHIPNQRFSYTC